MKLANFISIKYTFLRSFFIVSLFSDDQLTALIMDVLIAGSDTSASLLSFSILFLCLNPEYQRKIHEEIDKHVPRDRLPNLKDRPK